MTTKTMTDGALVVQSAQMRAILQSAYGSTDVFTFGEAARPRAGRGEVVVRVHAAGLDRGTWHLMEGKPYLMRIMGFGFSKPNNPVPGLDLAGTVVEVGPEVTRLAVGDEVFGIGLGSFAEFARAREDKLARKPGKLSFEQAAVLGISGSTALQALRDSGRLQAGQRVLIIGASGGVGSYAVQLARAMGATVTGVCSAGKVDFVRSLGADEVIDYGSTDFSEGSARYDLILDIGGSTPLARTRRVLAEKGTLVFVGGEGDGDWVGGLMLRALGAMVLSLFSSQRFTLCGAKERASDLEALAQRVEAGQLAPAVDCTYPLHEAPQAMRQLVAGKVRGKIAISVQGVTTGGSTSEQRSP